MLQSAIFSVAIFSKSCIRGVRLHDQIVTQCKSYSLFPKEHQSWFILQALILRNDQMDPVSTGVSLAASLVTLLAVAASSCESICSIQSRLCKAPDDIQRLVADVHTFQTLLSDVELSSRKLGDEEIPSNLRAIWLKCGEQMRQDLVEFKDIADLLEQSLNGPSAIGRNVIARVRRILSEPTVQTYQKLFSRHIEILGFIDSSINRYVSGSQHDQHRIMYLIPGFDRSLFP